MSRTNKDNEPQTIEELKNLARDIIEHPYFEAKFEGENQTQKRRPDLDIEVIDEILEKVWHSARFSRDEELKGEIEKMFKNAFENGSKFENYAWEAYNAALRDILSLLNNK